MSSNIDLSKFLSEPSDILKRLYKDTPIVVLTKEEFDNLSLNENYIKEKKRKKKKKYILKNRKNET
jgi:hypothetical protein